MWLEHLNFIAIVRRIIISPVTGRPPQVVINKLRSLKKALKTWNWEVFGDLNCAIVRKSAELHSIQLDLSNCGFSDDLFMAEKKCYRGNLAMKIDIRKAFDILDWSFLCRVLQAFDLSSAFVDRIDDILRLSRLSVLSNGVPEGYLCCSKGVFQRDLLSPFLFGIAKDFLSILLTRMVGSS
ncbi:hypothetical protein Dsin_012926 [Dipteronia sinensis]|uniref:Reverse transcriptase domain-containing protein n=1 Tax=Dipteronia sinensis TaxID=43782 RepID=A0AAE0AJ69_9ROSI|nr:hypothetical protein Dsin_012926 [Dipteronia sinensis]